MPSNQERSASPDNIAKWQCPYCGQTRQNLRDLRDHITKSTAEDHQGVDGLKPTRDIIAYGTNGEEVDRVEAVSTGPADPIEEYDKREIIINAWVSADDPDRSAVEAISGASQQYVSRLINQLDSGEIPRETWIEALDYGLRDELAERLTNYEEKPEAPEEDTVSAQETADDIVDESSKKDRIIAAYRVSPSINKNDAADALDVSYEYVRQIFKDIEDRAPSEWKKLREGDLDQDLSPDLLNAVEMRLRETGAETPRKEDAGETETESPPEWEQQKLTASVSGTVAAADVQEIRERMDLLLEQAEYTESSDAEFVARKGLEWIDELLESAE